MEFDNNKSIFLQIADTISERVVKGSNSPGEKVPSVRELAADLGVNPNTIMRTCSELQTARIIENKRGIGYFVHPDARKIILQQKKAEFFSRVLPEFVRHTALLGIHSNELKKHLDQLNNENHENQ